MNRKRTRSAGGMKAVCIFVAGFLWIPFVGVMMYFGPSSMSSSMADHRKSEEPSMAVDAVAMAKNDLQKMQSKCEAIEPVLRQLEADRESLRQQLRAFGVSGSQDLADNPRAVVIARELAEVVASWIVSTRRKSTYEDAVFELKAIDRRLERQAAVRGAGVSEDELAAIDVSLRSIKARISDETREVIPLSDADVDRAVDTEMR